MSDVMLQTTGLTKSFRGRRVVDDLDLRVMEGDVYGFLGPNGAGKSTTIRMIVGLVHPNQGSAKLLGVDVHSDRTRALRSVGALVESPTFYKYMSGRDNLRILARLSGECDDRRIDQVLETVDLLDRARDKVKTYSQGMRQRLGIAQALLPNPRLVILDEPTNGLDPQGMKDMRGLIERLARDEKVTVFVSSHLLHEVEQVCTQVGIINRGKLVAQGDVQSLLQTETDLVDLQVSDSAKAMQILALLRGIRLADPEGVTANGHLTISAARASIPEANRALVAAGVDVFAITPQSTTLESLFLRITGEGDGAH